VAGEERQGQTYAATIITRKMKKGMKEREGRNKRDSPRAPCPSSCLLGRVNQRARRRIIISATPHMYRRRLRFLHFVHSGALRIGDTTRTAKMHARSRVRDRPPRAQSHRYRQHVALVTTDCSPFLLRCYCRRDWPPSETVWNFYVARSVGFAANYLAKKRMRQLL